MGLLEKIKELEREMERTQKNKATEHHFGLMKARMAKMRNTAGTINNGNNIFSNMVEAMRMPSTPSATKVWVR